MGEHKPCKLVDVQVLVREKNDVSSVPASEHAPKNIRGNGHGNIAKVVRAQGDAQENHDVVDQESVGPRKPPILITFGEVFQVDFLQDVEVGEDEEGVDANDVEFIYVRVSPNFVHIFLTERKNEGRVGHVV